MQLTDFQKKVITTATQTWGGMWGETTPEQTKSILLKYGVPSCGDGVLMLNNSNYLYFYSINNNHLFKSRLQNDKLIFETCIPNKLPITFSTPFNDAVTHVFGWNIQDINNPHQLKTKEKEAIFKTQS